MHLSTSKGRVKARVGQEQRSNDPAQGTSHELLSPRTPKSDDGMFEPQIISEQPQLGVPRSRRTVLTRTECDIVAPEANTGIPLKGDFERMALGG